MEKNDERLETELKLGLPGSSGGGCGGEVEKSVKKRLFSDISGGGGEVEIKNEKKRVFSSVFSGEEEEVVENKNEVVGWPPVCAYRRRNGGKMYVKVSMDGAPFLRKINLCMHKGYFDLVKALEQLFGIEEALKEEENCEYVPIYEDKDGDWMLLGDVPWKMFIDSCKRLRIMKRSDANGVGLHAKDLLKGLSKEE
ncbi:hypothetical protein BUALT_Bualt02G0112900 [Buddleja alternifolia]|uniref:Auxin-responsive protein n=1 Tax=Buddleja alternifolia TaxID=168488 RepID=A0AAV6XZF5_9LAMI|nr:hypothetical protein BUALT_Bualt02G0112900 [Buddleja alternifolia]